MDCTVVREALSARLDGEPGPIAEIATDEHLAGCSSCRAWQHEANGLHRLVRVRSADPVPDLSAAIVAAHRPAARPNRTGWVAAHVPLGEPISTVRWALFVVALTQLVLAGPLLLLGDDPGATVHVARELGAFDLALAIGLLVAAWQPARAWGLVPAAVALGFVMAGTAVLDLADGSASIGREVHHVLDLAGVFLLCLVAREARAGDVRAPRPRAA